MEITQNYSIIISFSAGLLSFASPCILPLIPAYLSYITGASIQNLKTGGEFGKNILLSTIFVLGFTFVFTLLGASATWIGKKLLLYQDNIRVIGSIIVTLFGLHLTGILKIQPLYKQKKIGTGRITSGYANAFIMGIIFAFGWTPCVGPVLASLLIMASAEESMLKGIFLLFCYSLGIGIPFIITAAAMNKMLSVFTRLKAHYRKIEITTGILLIAAGILLFLNKFQSFINM